MSVCSIFMSSAVHSYECVQYFHEQRCALLWVCAVFSWAALCTPMSVCSIFMSRAVHSYECVQYFHEQRCALLWVCAVFSWAALCIPMSVCSIFMSRHWYEQHCAFLGVCSIFMSRYWYACQCLGGCTDTVRESVLEVDSGRKIPCGTRDSNPHQHCLRLFSQTLHPAFDP